MNSMQAWINRGSRMAAFCFVALVSFSALVGLAPQALASPRSPYAMEILVDGVPVQQYVTQGAAYIEALEGREYSIRLTNNTAQPVAIALSVDGLNTIDARSTTARDASKWILDPYQSITLDGWQTGADTARRFVFTTEPKSYGAWLGQTRDLGIISAAVFRPREARPTPYSMRMDSQKAPAAPQGGISSLGAPQEERRESESKPSLSDDYAATGIGQEIGHTVRRVRFDAQAAPSTVLNVRYEFREALVRLGVLPRAQRPCEDPLARRERSRGFEEMTFAPDPYRPRCH